MFGDLLLVGYPGEGIMVNKMILLYFQADAH